MTYITSASGNDTEVQYNDNGGFAGDPNLTWNSSTNTLNTTNLNINSESISGTRLYYAYDTTGGVSVTTTPQTVLYDTEVIVDPGYSNSFGEISITETGIYEVSFSLTTESDGTAGAPRTYLSCFIELDTGGGFNEVLGSGVSNYIREQGPGNTRYSVSNTVPINVTSNNSVIRVRFVQDSNTSFVTLPDQSSIYVRRIRPN